MNEDLTIPARGDFSGDFVASGLRESQFMAAPDESTGLKIAVGALVTLSVILSVALFFLYSAYSSAQARLDSALHEIKQLSMSQSLLRTQYDELKKEMSQPADSRPK
jgi:hypothetical protein